MLERPTPITPESIRHELGLDGVKFASEEEIETKRVYLRLNSPADHKGFMLIYSQAEAEVLKEKKRGLTAKYDQLVDRLRVELGFYYSLMHQIPSFDHSGWEFKSEDQEKILDFAMFVAEVMKMPLLTKEVFDK